MGSQTQTNDAVAAVRAERRRLAAHPRTQSTRTRYDWTPASYLAAVRSAESGNMAGLGQFVRWLLTDDKIESALAQRVDVMLAMDPVFDPVVSIPEDWYETYPFEEQQLQLNIGIMAGFCWSRFKPDLETCDELSFTVETWWPEHFDYRAHEGLWYVRTMDGYAPIIDGRDGWRLFTPFGAHEPWQRGKWKSVAIPTLLKHLALDDRARNSEVGALLVGEIKDAGDDERQLFLEDLQSLAKETRVVLPEGGKLNLLDRSASGQASIQKEQISWSDDAITTALLAQLVTTNGAAGFSSGQPQLVVLNAVLKAQEKAFSGFVSVKLLSPWLELMHPDTLDAWELTHPEFNRVVYERWPVEVSSDAETAAKKFDDSLQGFLKAISSVKDAGFTLVQTKVDELAKQYGVPSFQLPATATARLTLAPTDLAKAIRVIEARASEGLPPMGDERDKLTMAELDAAIKAGTDFSAPPPVAPADPGAPTPEQQSMQDDTAAKATAELAAFMTAPGNAPDGTPLPPVARCEHNMPNKCKLCRVVRQRGGTPQFNADGSPMVDEQGNSVVKWTVGWRPMTEADQ